MLAAPGLTLYLWKWWNTLWIITRMIMQETEVQRLLLSYHRQVGVAVAEPDLAFN